MYYLVGGILRIFQTMLKTIPNERLALILILLCAAALRLAWLNWSLPNRFHTATYNCDESTALTCLQAMDPSKLNFNPVSQKHPYALVEGTFNLYTYAAALKLASIAGWATLTADKEFYYRNIAEMGRLFMIGRLLSALYGLLTVVLVFALAKKMYGARTGLLAAFFTAVLPAHVVHSRYIIMNVPGVFWIVFAFLFMKNILEGGRTRDYILAGVGLGLAAATRLSGAPLGLMLFPAHFMSPAPGRSLKRLSLAVAAAFLVFLIGDPYAILDFPDFLKGMKLLNTLTTSAVKLSFYGHLSILAGSLTEALGLPLLLTCMAGIAAALAARTRNDLLLLAWIFLLFICFYRAGENAYPSRILPALPFMLILAAALLARAWDRKPWLARAALAATAAQAVVFYAAYFSLLSRADIRDTASSWITTSIKPGSSIGLLREPSYFSPGVIDRKYRHPDHDQLPDYKFIALTGGYWLAEPGYELLGKVKPDYVIATDFETGSRLEPDFLKTLDKYGYREIKRFEEEFSVLNFRIAKKIPAMLYTPNYIYVFEKSGRN